MVRGTTTGLASHSTRNSNAIHNKMKDCYHNGKLSQTSRRKYGDEVPPELQSKLLQAVHWRSLLQLSFTSEWTRSILPEIPPNDPPPNLNFWFYFAGNEQVHSCVLGVSDQCSTLAALGLDSERKIGIQRSTWPRARSCLLSTVMLSATKPCWVLCLSISSV